MLERITNLFWLLALLGVTWAWIIPAHFSWFAPFIPLALGLIMLGMGLTLTLDHFRAVLAEPLAIGIGVAAQFLLMPTLGFFIAKSFQLDPGLAAGLILVSCCPGGTASNVIAFLAKANVALSVLMTMCSTILAVILTPLMTGWLAGQYVEVDKWTLFKTTIILVLMPVILGIALNRFFPKQTKRIATFSPLLSVVAIILIGGCIISLQKEAIADSGWPLLAAIIVLHGCAFVGGYIFATLAKRPEDERRTVSIEVGMQNSGLAATLAASLASPLAALPSAISAIIHCLLGSLAAGWWRRH